MNASPTAFFAYPNVTRISDAINAFSEEINKAGLVEVLPWESMQIGGKLLVSEICKSIDERDVFLADITKLNPNVLFELGYAIARKKRIWLIRDNSLPEENTKFKEFKILTNLGYREYLNSRDIIKLYYKDCPHDTLDETVYDNVLDQSLGYTQADQILYLKADYEDEASIKVSQKLSSLTKKAPIGLQVDDPRDGGVQPLVWYASNVYNSRAVICHLTHIERQDSRIQNAKHSLIAGMAYGFEIPVLMLIEDDPLGPTDYRDLQYSYSNSNNARDKINSFISPYINQAISEGERFKLSRRKKNKIDALSRLKLGEPIAEHEDSFLVRNSFVETSAYISALRGECSIFVGRKGVGKTANFIKLTGELSKDRRNLVCEVSPLSYELTNLIEVAKKFEKISQGGYLFESLWKFLLYSEVAKCAYEEINTRPSRQVFKNEEMLTSLVEDNRDMILVDFSSRMDRLVKSLLDATVGADDFQKDKIAVSEILHSGILPRLVKSIALALESKMRIAIVVDNLDKAWDKSGQTKFLSYFFLGLLSAQKRAAVEFRGIADFQFTLCIFVRADIFEFILDVAREPDKIAYEQVTWDDADKLKVLADTRILAASGDAEKVTSEHLWEKFFIQEVDDLPLLDFIFTKILMRPRDLLFFLRAAIFSAVNSRHDRVEEKDLKIAEEEYSNFAYQSLLVEIREKFGEIEDILAAFMGAEPELKRDYIANVLLEEFSIDSEEIIYSLCMCGFLEVSIPSRSFQSINNDKQYKRLLRAAENIITRRGGEITYRIHPAFWNFLIIEP